jgi:hypothetical protein
MPMEQQYLTYMQDDSPRASAASWEHLSNDID